MVYLFTCFNTGDEQESDDKFVTARSQFSQPQGSATTSQNVDYINSGVPNLNGGSRSSPLREFKLAELNKATNSFDQSTKIGEGGFGSVHLGIIKRSEHPFDDVRVAVKRGKKGQKVQRQWQTEVDVLGKIEHQNLVKLIGYCHEEHENESDWLLVYEYMPNRSLDYHLSSTNTSLPWPTRLKIARDAAVGLTYLHEGRGPNNEIIFRDFKPSNVLLDKDWNAKLSDFGYVREGPPDGQSHVSTLVVGTNGYAAPEYVSTGRITSKIDVWSYGIFLKQLVTGQRPVVQKNTEMNPACMRWACCYVGAGKSKPVVDPRLGNEYSDSSVKKILSIADKCLVTNHKLRPTMSEVLKVVNEAIELQNQHPS
ncbi:serine/threonine-protein kinase PCRK1-like [Bidens hawaiensis]|uniref:serine/threonine-protein kinase PCRK1-like n=1 Tax=Bidens hawaiensis TaxID=980011 RepID=UPI00404A1AC4